MNLALANTMLFSVSLFSGLAIGWYGLPVTLAAIRRMVLDPIVNATHSTWAAALTLAHMRSRKGNQ
jgi:hypothetical protein